MSFIIQDSKNTKVMGDGKVMLTDENGKEIVLDVNDINDASTYSRSDIRNIENFNKNNVSIACKITDEDGNVINERDLITDVKSGEVTALDVTFEATHSGRRINYALYPLFIPNILLIILYLLLIKKRGPNIYNIHL